MDFKRLFLGPTVVEFAWIWREDLVHGDASRYRLKSDIKTYIEPFWDGKRVKRVTREDINNYCIFLNSLKNQKNKRPLSPYTIITALTHLRAIFNYAIKNGMIKQNPMQGINFKKPLSIVKYFNHEQVEILLHAIYPTDYHKLAVYLALCTGMRRGEIIALEWEDIDLDKRLLYIRRSVNVIQGTKYPKLPKSGKERVAIINRELEEILRLNFMGKGLVVPLMPWQITGWFPHFAEKLGLPKLSFHTLRKTFGTLLLQSGVDIKTVSVLLGHSNISITSQSYIGVSQKNLQEAVNSLFK